MNMADTSLVIALFSVVVCVVWWFTNDRKNARRLKLLRQLPGPTTLPFFGNLRELGFWSSATKKFSMLSIFFQTRTGLGQLFRGKKLYCLWIGRRPVVVLFQAEAVEPLLKSNVLIDKGDFYKFIQPWLGNGLLTSHGEMWRSHRKLLTPTFHFRILDNFLIVMNEQSSVLVEKIQDASKCKEWVDVLHYLSMCTLDIICETAMGTRIEAQNDSESVYVKAVQELLDLMATRGPRPWLSTDFIYYRTEDGQKFKKALKTLHNFTETVIKERMSGKRVDKREKEDDEGLGKKKLAFLDLLLEAGESVLTPEQLREQVDTFMFAGHDTTSTALSWVFYLLGLSPDIQNQLLDEVDRVFDGDKTRPVTQEDLKELKYMDNVMKESQRLYPSVPGFARHITEDLQIGEYTIPAGTTLAVNTYLVHRDPEVYPDPEKFDPDRFLPEKSIGRNPFAFIPFSAGARNCIGQRYAMMEQKVILCHILRNFRVQSLDHRDLIILKPAAVLRTEGQLRIKFLPR